METRCNGSQLVFPALGRRKVVAEFDAGHVTSDAGALLLGLVSEGTALFELAADCFTDHRDPDRTEHSVADLLAQRVLGLALGYEDLNDHATLARDPALAAAIGKLHPLGDGRRRRDHQGLALASPATLNRLENTPAELNPTRPDQKLVHHPDKFEALFVDRFLDAHEGVPETICLDLDATDVPLHGEQEGRGFHGYYRCYCYLPLYIFCGEHLLAAKLRPSLIDGAAGALEEVQRIVAHIRRRWPEVRVVLRADSGFCRDPLLAWCEATEGVDYVIGLAKNSRLNEAIEALFLELADRAGEEEAPTRLYGEFRYRTQKSWSCERRVVAKAEVLGDKRNPRYVVTSLAPEDHDARAIYTELYCPRGDAENRIKEQQLDLFADRTSAHTMRANQLRLWLSSLAYLLLVELRQRGLKGTKMEKAQCGTIRLRLLKIGAVVSQSVRRLRFSLSSLFPGQELFAQVLANLYRAYPFLVPT